MAGSVISLTNQSGVTISGKSIAGGSAASITLCNCNNITVTNCKLYNSTNVGIYLYNCYNITIKGNYFTNLATGVNVVQCPKGGIEVNSNQFLNMMGPYPKGQFVQFNNVGGAYNQINSNICENIMGESKPEDAISIYESNGTAASPITINGNEIRGGGPSTSGGGIMIGDSGGSYITANGNTLVNPGQYGIAISGGSHNAITNNIVYGAKQSFTNIGMYVEAIGANISAATVSGNRVKFYNSAGVCNGAWLASGLATPSGWTNNNWNANIDASVLPATLITDH
jgi:parallel beta-helix repeat protein